MLFSKVVFSKEGMDAAYQDQTMAALVALGLVSNCGLILSPVISIWRILSGTIRNEYEIQSLAGPYFFLYAQSHFWALYGVTTGTPEISYINVLGAMVCLMYLVIMASYADEKGNTHVQMLLALAVLGTGVISLFTLMIDIADLRAEVLAYAGVSFTILMMIAPMKICVEVLRRRNTAGFPMALTVAGFVSCCLWSQYSALTHDIFYLIPNLCGILCNGIQIAIVTWVHVWYPDGDDGKELSLKGIRTEIPRESLPLLRDSDDRITNDDRIMA